MVSKIRTVESIAIPKIKFYYRAIIIKTALYWNKSKHVDKLNWIEDQDKNCHTFGHQFLIKKTKIYTINKTESLANDGGQTGWLHVARSK